MSNVYETSGNHLDWLGTANAPDGAQWQEVRSLW